MVCSCCGGEMAADGLSCSCGARVVGQPLQEPEFIVPKIGKPVFALVLAILSTPAFFWKWLIILAVMGLFLSRNASQKIKADPRHFGGKRTALAAMTLSIVILLGVTTYIIAGIPKYLYWRAESQRAATRAQLYKVAIALHDYKHKHGSYPVSLDDLQVDTGSQVVFADRWDNKLEYQTTTELAADSNSEMNPSAVTFNQYQIVSPGPDGKLGTGDDMVMRDDMILSQTETDSSINDLIR